MRSLAVVGPPWTIPRPRPHFWCSRAQKSLRTPAPGEAINVDGDEEGSAPRGFLDWDVNGRKELLFAQIIGLGTKPFLTNRANIPVGRD